MTAAQLGIGTNAAISPGPSVVPYAVTIFISATLLFLVEPIAAKQLLPWFGGAAAVWTACLMFFQVVLLLGYLYAHWSIRTLTRVNQLWIHGALLLVSGGLLWWITGEQLRPATLNNPIAQVVRVLTLSIGLPYFALSSTGPLLQAWFSVSSQGPRPYKLFALSNLGSLLGLLAYPFALEPTLELRTQIFLWRVGYGIFVVLCGALCLRTTVTAEAGGHARPKTGPDVSIRSVAVWVAFAACSSILLYGVTSTLCQDIAPVPLLWIAPLAVYLLSFTICFEGSGRFRPKIYKFAVPAALLALVSHSAWPVAVAVPLFIGALFVLCMYCHGELSRRKPSSDKLTSFYLSISSGGALGGLLAGLFAPMMFDYYFELQVGLALCLLLCLSFLFHLESRPFAAAIVLATLTAMYLSSGVNDKGIRFRGRNFYGVLSVREQRPPAGEVRTLVHGSTVHGGQFLDGKMRREPGYYYGRESGVGMVLQIRRPRRVGIVGLGVGTLAAYGGPGDFYRFYEINPLVEQLARSRFTWLRDSAAHVEVIPGDARLALESERDERFDTLVLDAFSGDSIPVHLLTKEAFECYFGRLTPTGILAVHISNRYLDLAPVVADIAANSGRIAVSVSSPANKDRNVVAAKWVLVTRDAAYARELQQRQLGVILKSGGARLWSDQYSNVVGVLRF